MLPSRQTIPSTVCPVLFVSRSHSYPSVEKLMTYPRFAPLTSINLDGLIVVKTEQEGKLLTKRLPQMLVEMYTSAKDLKYDLILSPMPPTHIFPERRSSAVLSPMDMNGFS